MSHQPQPIAQSFLVCREIIQDRHSPATFLVNPFQKVSLPGYPASFPATLFLQITGGHGVYLLSIQFQDDSGSVLSEVHGPKSESMNNPIEYHQVYWRNIQLKFPRPGQYALVLLANGEEIGRHAIEASFAVNS